MTNHHIFGFELFHMAGNSRMTDANQILQRSLADFFRLVFVESRFSVTVSGQALAARQAPLWLQAAQSLSLPGHKAFRRYRSAP